MRSWLRWVLDRVIITAIAVLVIGGGTWLALNTSWLKAPRRGTPVGEITPEEVRREPALTTRSLTVGLRPPGGWKVVSAECWAETREAIAVESIEIRTGSGRVVAREAATTFADGDRTLISFPVITQSQRIAISARYAMEEPGDERVRFVLRYVKLGRGATVLRRQDGTWVPTTTLAADGRTRDPATGLYAHALTAVEFRERRAEFPFEAGYEVAVPGTPPPSLLAARKRARVPDGPCIWLRGEDAWLLEGDDGRTRLVGPGPAESLPGRLVALAEAIRERETSRQVPPFEGVVRAGGLTVTAENLIETVRRLDSEGRKFDGLSVRDR